MKKVINKLHSLTALLLTLVLMFGVTGCGPVTPNGSLGGNEVSLEPLPAESNDDGVRGDPLNQPIANTKPNKANDTANVFICAEQSMMGFADWKYDTIYETAVSLLADEVNALSTSFYRYDGYDIGKDAMLISSAATLKNDIKDIGFYSSLGISQDETIPSNVQRYSSDKLESLSTISPWLSDEVIEDTLAQSTYPLENAIKHFDANALNVVVTDFYELRNGSLKTLEELQNYDIGILAIQSEYSGTLADFPAPGEELVWGSPMTGSYKSHSVKSARYTKQDGTYAYYSYNVFEAYTSDERIAENRTFYILFAGNAESVATMMNAVSNKLSDKYANSTIVELETGSLLIQNGFYSSVCENIRTDTAGASEYIALQYGEDYTDAFGFEIREADDVPSLRVAADYFVGTGASDRTLSASDFNITTTCLKLGTTATEYSAPTPKCTIEDGGNGSLTPVLTYNPDDLPPGEYVFETHISVLPPEQSKSEAEFLNAWGINVDDGSLRQWVQSYLAGEGEGIDKIRNLMVHTLGLSNIFEPLDTEASAREILAVRIYFNVV